MGKKSNNTLRAEKNISAKNFTNCKMITDDIYSNILNYDSTELVSSLIFELFLRVEGFRIIYDDCYTSIMIIREKPKLFTYQSTVYQELIAKYEESVQVYNYNIHDILVYISLEIAKINNITFGKYENAKFTKYNPLLEEVFLNKDYEILKDLGVMNYISGYSDNLSLYRWNFKIPQNKKFKQKSINVTINLHKNSKGQSKELDKIKQLMKQEESNLSAEKIINELDILCNKLKQEGILLHLYLYDCGKKNTSSKYIIEHTNKYLKSVNLKIDEGIKSKLKSTKDERTVKLYIKIIEDLIEIIKS